VSTYVYTPTDNADHVCIDMIRNDPLYPYIREARWIALSISPFLSIDNAINAGLPDMDHPDRYGSRGHFLSN
jgi:hypothetical protein